MDAKLPTVKLVAAGELDAPAIAGTKAYRLRGLVLQGCNVPDFFCVAADCRQQYIALPARARPLYEARLQQELSAYTALHFSPGTLFSVRTSALAEDGSDASYAGQFTTVLRVAPDALAKAVLQCWQAVESTQISVYKERRSLTGDLLAAGIIIQKMIEAELSGVAFSANPQGILNETVVVCGSGTGDNVVEDRVPTTTYYYNLYSKQFYYEQQPGAPLLGSAMLQQLTGLLEMLGAEAPVDIEYAIQDDTLWILQQRPITALDTEQPVILDNSNIVESYGGLCLPLTVSFAKYVYTQVFEGLARRCLPQKALPQYRPALRQMVNSVNGRMYYQISNWYTVLKFMPMQSKIIPVWQRMLGVQAKQYDKTANPLPRRRRIQTYGKLAAAAFGIPKKMRTLEKDFAEMDALFRRQFHTGMPPAELAHLFAQLGSIVLRNWDITLLNDMYAFVFTALLERQFKKSGIENHKEQSNRYLAGNKELESMKPVRAAWALAQKIRQDTALQRQLLALQSNGEVQAFFADGRHPVAEDILRYLDLYGDRSHEELKLETETFRSHPIGFIHLLLAYANGTMPEPMGASLPKQAGGLEKISFLRRAFIQYYGKRARLGIAHREVSRLNRGRIFGMVRSIFTEMGIHLHQAGLISHPRDVFYLDMQEVFAYAQQKESGAEFARSIERRKSQYEGFALLPAYSRLIFAGKVFDKQPRFAQSGAPVLADGLLQGTPCSAGVVTGEAIVVTAPVQADRVRDKILVARTTDPGWVFLLAVAKGVIAEKGSLLSHTAIITRELGLPSVVGVENATEILKSGDIVRLDGGKGTVEKCND